MKLTQLTSPWDHGVTFTYQAFEFREIEDATRYGISFNGEPMINGWLRIYKEEATSFYIYLNEVRPGGSG